MKELLAIGGELDQLLVGEVAAKCPQRMDIVMVPLHLRPLDSNKLQSSSGRTQTSNCCP